MKLVARFYNGLSSKWKIIVMVSSSMILAGIIKQFLSDVALLNDVNGYVKAVLDGITFPLGVILNVLQQFIKDKGTQILASENDRSTMKMLDAKIEEVKDIKRG